jgi:hypothetical protein
VVPGLLVHLNSFDELASILVNDQKHIAENVYPAGGHLASACPVVGRELALELALRHEHTAVLLLELHALRQLAFTDVFVELVEGGFEQNHCLTELGQIWVALWEEPHVPGQEHLVVIDSLEGYADVVHHIDVAHVLDQPLAVLLGASCAALVQELPVACEPALGLEFNQDTFMGAQSAHIGRVHFEEGQMPDQDVSELKGRVLPRIAPLLELRVELIMEHRYAFDAAEHLVEVFCVDLELSDHDLAALANDEPESFGVFALGVQNFAEDLEALA